MKTINMVHTYIRIIYKGTHISIWKISDEGLENIYYNKKLDIMHSMYSLKTSWEDLESSWHEYRNDRDITQPIVDTKWDIITKDEAFLEMI